MNLNITIHGVTYNVTADEIPAFCQWAASFFRLAA